jgi:hypothetical protein
MIRRHRNSNWGKPVLLASPYIATRFESDMRRLGRTFCCFCLLVYGSESDSNLFQRNLVELRQKLPSFIANDKDMLPSVLLIKPSS